MTLPWRLFKIYDSKEFHKTRLEFQKLQDE